MKQSSDSHLHPLAGVAASLWERSAALSINVQHDGETTDPAEEGECWLGQIWLATLGQDPRRLEARLAWQGLSRSDLGALEHPKPAQTDETLPLWARIVERAVSMHPGPCFDPEEVGLSLGVNREEPLPFEEFWFGFLTAARLSLRQHVSPAQLSLLAPEAWQALERSLLLQLSHLGAAALEKEFDQVRPPALRLLSIFTGGLSSLANSTHYRRFMEQQLEDGGLALLERWPVLARLAGRLTELWLESTREFLERLQQDLGLLPHRRAEPSAASHGAPDRSASCHECQFSATPVRDLLPLCSDRHNGGRSVQILTLSCGCRCVYKPRPVSMERAFQQLLAWCNRQGDVPIQQRCIQVLDRGPYGWMEWVEASACTQSDEVKLFFERAGMLMALVHLLRGNDCHRENLIAASQWPVLVDGETLLTARLRPELMDSRQPPDGEDDYSVLQSGFLPCWDLVFRGRQALGIDVSALGHHEPFAEKQRRLGWLLVNTDAMHQGLIPVGEHRCTNLPVLAGHPQEPKAFLPDLVRGFERAHLFLRRNRQQLLDPGSPLNAFKDCSVRYLFRVTRLYDDLIARSLGPSHLRCAITRSVHLDQLALAYLEGPASRQLVPLLNKELEALENLDIPYLQVSTTERHLCSGSRLLVKDAFVMAPFAAMEHALQHLDEQDLQRQLQLIRGSFQAQRARPLSRQTPGGELTEGTSAEGITAERLTEVEPLQPEELLREACQIADGLLTMAQRRSDGSQNWIGMAILPNSHQFRLRQLGASLFDGQVGIALFLADLAIAVPEERYREAAMGALRTLCRWVEGRQVSTDRPSTVLGQGIGGASGLAGLVYGLVRIGDLLDSEEWLPVATKLAGWIDADAIAADRQLDVIGGCAGAILGLLTLHGRTGATAPLQAAALCGERLIEQRVMVHESGLRAWQTLEPQPLTGFSHGAAGISLALLRLHAATGRSEFREAALEGIAFERSVFSRDDGNWPDLRSHGASRAPWYLINWCHGAAGIGLARLAGLSWLDDPEVRVEIATAVSTTLAWGGQGVDHLCCGNMGRVQLLQEAGLRLHRPELSQGARQLASWMVMRARRTGYYRLLPDVLEPVQMPGFFQGLAGIGHGLLRLGTGGRALSVCQWQ